MNTRTLKMSESTAGNIDQKSILKVSRLGLGADFHNLYSRDDLLNTFYHKSYHKTTSDNLQGLDEHIENI